MQCPACHAKAAAGAVFCQQCGAHLGDPETQLTPADRFDALPPRGEDAESVERASPQGPGQSALERFRAAAKQRQSPADDAEEELWQGGFSARAMVGPWCASAMATAAFFVFGIWRGLGGTGWGYLLLAVIAAWVVPLLLLAYRKLNVAYRLTTQRLFHERGILRRVTDRIEVIDMDDITYSQGILERMLGVGTIQVVSSDKTHPEFWIRGIDDVSQVAALVDDARRKERIRRGLHIEAV